MSANSQNDNSTSPSYRKLASGLICGIAYFFSNPKPQSHYDYTLRVAENLLRGQIAFTEKPPSWLNEFVQFDGFYYSVFPLGGVLSMIPFALLKVIGIVSAMPSELIAALLAAVICYFLFLIASRYELSKARLIMMPIGVLFGTWTWTNLTMGGAWQLALGFAMIGELGAIYFTVYNRKPILAGLFFALAFGNRTEVLLTAPVCLYLLNRRDAETQRNQKDNEMVQRRGDIQRDKSANESDLSRRLGVSAVNFRSLTLFCTAPFILGVATLVYNYIRFQSFSDFGYSRIPGVLDEPWYNHGIFSYQYIPRQAWEMLLRIWEWRPTFPFPMPNPFSSSILISSPFLVFAFRFGSRDRILKYASWIAVVVLCVLLWMHGNSGGWQFGYRYAMVLLPWLFVILLESSPKKISPLEWAAYIFSFGANAYATWLFHWTTYLKP